MIAEKIKVYFNDKYYLVGTEFLSAYDDLHSHLSTMKGSGAMINLDGVDYNIDSTKLSNATNDFTSHLGTIAGNGRKIKVGGVEYSIDSTKLNSAISELESVLGNLNSSDSDSVNEYGFYFNTPYKTRETTTFINGVEVYISMTFYQDCSCNMTITDTNGNEISNNTVQDNCTYEQNKINLTEDGKTSVLLVLDSGKIIDFNGNYLYLDKNTDPDLNKYGFYFNRKYTAGYSNSDNSTTYDSYIFYEDGTVVFESTAVNEVENKEWNSDAVLSENGTVITSTVEGLGTTVLTLSEDATSSINEYGYYYGEKYIGKVYYSDLGMVDVYRIYYEDKTVECIRSDKLQMGLTYENGKILFNGELFATFSNDGKQFTFGFVEGSLVYILD